jgi:hypothetical protein
MSALMVSVAILQFLDTCGKRRNLNLILDVTPIVTDRHSNVNTQNAF